MTSAIEISSCAFGAALLLSAGLTPLARRAALRWGILDRPSTPVKTHQSPTPYLGGLAIYAAFAGALVALRWVTHFPSGTLRALWALLAGGGFMAVVGLVDDLWPGGMNFRRKFLFQALGAVVLILFDIRIRFIQPDWLAMLFTIVWVVGVTNAFNLIDIMDGLSSSQALTASLGFLFLALPNEEIYVNTAAAALAGACLGFLPYNLSSKKKIFMGDAGSLFLGFTLAAVSMGVSYTRETDFGIFAPILILGLPVYDTFFVSTLRVLQGKSPFLGSKDHLALKLKALGLKPWHVVLVMAAVEALFCAAATVVTRAPFYVAWLLLTVLAVTGLYVVVRLHDVKVP